eukprot:365296-Chlamydomonas_euryale.AAC.41
MHVRLVCTHVLAVCTHACVPVQRVSAEGQRASAACQYVSTTQNWLQIRLLLVHTMLLCVRTWLRLWKQCSSATGNREHQFWEPSLDPPALLDGVVVVLVSPRRPISVGTVARAASCFEVGSLRIVQPRGEYVTRHSKSASKGAQYLLYRAREFDSVSDAVSDADLSIAFTRWVAGRSNAFFDLSAVLNHPVVQELICAPLLEDTNGNKSRARTRLALVFGREELGLSDAEVDACDAVCSIPIGRLQVSCKPTNSPGHVEHMSQPGLTETGNGNGNGNGNFFGAETETVYNTSESKPRCMYGLIYVQVHRITSN